MFRSILLAFAAMPLVLAGCKKSQPTDTNDSNSSAAVIKITYANFPPASTFPCVQMERWKQEVEKRTAGKVHIDTFPGGTLLDAKEMFDGVVRGQADIGCLCMAYQPGRFTVTNATALPLGIETAKIGSQVLFDLYNKYQPAEFKDVKVLTMFTTAPANIMSKKPVRNMDDLKGLDLRASGEAARILKSWGANQVGMPMSATPENLQKGVVQGLFSSVEVMKDFKFAEMCKYMTMTETVIYPFAVVMNKAKYEALPADIKQVFADLAVEQCVWTGEYMDQHVKDSVEWAKTQHNVEVIQLSSDEKSKWNALLEPVIQDWTKQADSAGFPASQILSDIRALITKYSQPEAQK